MAIAADLIRGHTDTIILAQLTHGDSYGYNINRVIQQITGGQYELKEATLYTAFRRLETAGLVRATRSAISLTGIRALCARRERILRSRSSMLVVPPSLVSAGRFPVK